MKLIDLADEVACPSLAQMLLDPASGISSTVIWYSWKSVGRGGNFVMSSIEMKPSFEIRSRVSL